MYECEFCEAKFISDEGIREHTCRQKERMQQLNTPLGRVAYSYYKLWFKYRKYLIPAKESFIVSKSYNPFLKFVKYAKKMGIPNVPLYIKFMSQEGILPQHWYNDDIYEYFIDYLDKECSHVEHLKITLKSFDRISEALDCDIGEIFDYMRPIDVINLIETRNLSPLVLFFSVKFRNFVKYVASDVEKHLIDQAMNVNRWKPIIESNADGMKFIKDTLVKVEL